MRIGVDFDNTIAGYDRLFAALSVEQGLLTEPPDGGKKAVRDRVRALHGDDAWQDLQATAYGRRMSEAEMFGGVTRFFALCREAHIPVYIVSHKTRFASRDAGGVDLRRAALTWMDDRGFFEATGFGLSYDHVFFEDTRTEKITRIASLHCDVFIDDLIEVFSEPRFPTDVSAILFAPDGEDAESPVPLFKAFTHWDEISDYVFGVRH
jgi:hypothetical protein